MQQRGHAAAAAAANQQQVSMAQFMKPDQAAVMKNLRDNTFGNSGAVASSASSSGAGNKRPGGSSSTAVSAVTSQVTSMASHKDSTYNPTPIQRPQGTPSES